MKIKVPIIRLKKKLLILFFLRLIISSCLVLASRHVKENTVHVKCANNSDKVKLKLCSLLQIFERCIEYKKVDVFSFYSATGTLNAALSFVSLTSGFGATPKKDYDPGKGTGM